MATQKTEEFIARTKKLVEFKGMEHEFCCPQHRSVFRDIKGKAVKFVESLENSNVKASFSVTQLDYARAIVMGKARHGGAGGQDPERQVATRCVHVDRFLGGLPWHPVTVRVQCQSDVVGTAKEVGAANTKCTEHCS